MLIVNEAFLKSDADRMALDHLFGIGAIIERSDRIPGKVKTPKIPKGRISWKSFKPMRGGGCGQCGDGGATSYWNGGGHSSLCQRCFKVLEHSRKYWVANDDFPTAG